MKYLLCIKCLDVVYLRWTKKIRLQHARSKSKSLLSWRNLVVIMRPPHIDYKNSFLSFLPGSFTSDVMICLRERDRSWLFVLSISRSDLAFPSAKFYFRRFIFVWNVFSAYVGLGRALDSKKVTSSFLHPS